MIDNELKILKHETSLLIKSGDYKGAIKLYKKAAAISKDDFDLHIGTCYFSLSEYELAIFHLLKAEIFRGTSDNTSTKIAISLKRVGKFRDMKQRVISHMREYGYNKPLLDVLAASDSVLLSNSEHNEILAIVPEEDKTPNLLRALSKKVSQNESGLIKGTSLKSVISSLNLDNGPIFNFNNIFASGTIVFSDAAILAQQKSHDLKLQAFTYWDKDPAPVEIQHNIASWKLASTDQQILYNDDDAKAFIGKHFDSSLLSAYEASRHPAMKSDIFRLAKLYIDGGLYFDADQIKGPKFDNFLSFLKEVDPEYALATMAYSGSNFIQNGMIYSRNPKSDLIGKCISIILENFKAGQFNDLKTSIQTITGPGVITSAFIDQLIKNTKILHNTVFISRSLMDLVSPEGQSEYKKDSALNWRGN